jgi:hypothetical protein
LQAEWHRAGLAPLQLQPPLHVAAVLAPLQLQLLLLHCVEVPEQPSKQKKKKRRKEKEEKEKERSQLLFLSSIYLPRPLTFFDFLFSLSLFSPFPFLSFLFSFLLFLFCYHCRDGASDRGEQRFGREPLTNWAICATDSCGCCSCWPKNGGMSGWFSVLAAQASMASGLGCPPAGTVEAAAAAMPPACALAMAKAACSRDAWFESPFCKQNTKKKKKKTTRKKREKDLWVKK